ncbi:MAG: arsenite methyltransferase [Candidatus Bathyarchaeia archaeon]
MKEEKVRKIVRKGYARIAKEQKNCCSTNTECCKTCADFDTAKGIILEEVLKSIPEGTTSLGCGSPIASASLKEGETVLDLGSGFGFDCFLAAKKVGDAGKVIGVDMTPEMVYRARENAIKSGYKNVEFRLGEIENLPVADSSVDVVISNCVINLSPNKKRVFEEAFRVLKTGGRLVISDIVLLDELPQAIRNDENAYVSCVSGAIRKEEYVSLIEQAGFREIKVLEETVFPLKSILDNPAAEKLRAASITICGFKPLK